MKDLTVDPERTHLPDTGIYVRALNEQGQWASVDIASLSRDSLIEWLHSRDDADFPVNVVLALLGHPQVGEAR